MRNKISKPWAWIVMLLGGVFLTLSITSCSSDDPVMDNDGNGSDDPNVSEAESWTKNLPNDTIKDFFIYTAQNFYFDYIGNEEDYHKRVEIGKSAMVRNKERGEDCYERHILYPYSLSNIRIERVWISKVYEATLPDDGSGSIPGFPFNGEENPEMTPVEIEKYKEWFKDEWCAVQVTPEALYCHYSNLHRDPGEAVKVLTFEISGLTSNNKIVTTDFTFRFENRRNYIEGDNHDKYANDQWLIFDNHDITVSGEEQQVVVTALPNNDKYERLPNDTYPVRFPGEIKIHDIKEWRYEIPQSWQCWRMTWTQPKIFDQYKKGIEWSWGNACAYCYNGILEDAKVYVNLEANTSGVERTVLVKLQWFDNLDKRYEGVNEFSEFYITQQSK